MGVVSDDTAEVFDFEATDVNPPTDHVMDGLVLVQLPHTFVEEFDRRYVPSRRSDVEGCIDNPSSVPV